MVMDYILTALGLAGLLAASYTDIKTKEVPDWLNYSLILSGLGLRLIYSFSTFDFSYLLYGIYGFLLFFIIAIAMFYLGQWGGGDSKMIMGLGAIMGFELNLDSFIIIFIVNVLFVGSFYGLIWSGIMALKTKDKFMKGYAIYSKTDEVKFHKKIILILAGFLIFLSFIVEPYLRILFLLMSLLLILMLYLFIFVKTIEKVCMLKKVDPKILTEGDWIAEPVIYNGKTIAGPKDLGIEKQQIKKLISLYQQKKIKKILLKTGIPFVPSFLIAYVLTILAGNWLVYLF